MHKLIIAIVTSITTLVSQAVAEKQTTMVINYDPGGSIIEYRKEIAEFIRGGGKRVVIDGVCASACLLWLHSEYNLKSCATNNAKLGFHIPYFISTFDGEIIYSDEHHEKSLKLAEHMLDGLPEYLQVKWYNSDIPDVFYGSKPTDVLIVEGNEAIKALGKCK